MATGYRGYTLTDAPVVQALQRDPRYALSQAQLAQALQSTPQTVPEALVRGLTGIVQARRSRGIEEQYGQQQEALQASRQRLAQALMGGDLAGAAAAASGSPYLADTGIQLGLTNIETQAKAAADDARAEREAARDAARFDQQMRLQAQRDAAAEARTRQQIDAADRRAAAAASRAGAAGPSVAPYFQRVEFENGLVGSFDARSQSMTIFDPATGVAVPVQEWVAAGNELPRVAKTSFDQARGTESAKAEGKAFGEAGAELALSGSDDIGEALRAIEAIDAFENHPGFSDFVGFGAPSTWLMGLPFIGAERPIAGTNAAGAAALYDQIKGINFASAVQVMRGLGHLSNMEGNAVTQAQAALDPSMPERDMRASLDKMRKYIRKGLERREYQRIHGPTAVMPGDREGAQALIERGLQPQIGPAAAGTPAQMPTVAPPAIPAMPTAAPGVVPAMPNAAPAVGAPGMSMATDAAGNVLSGPASPAGLVELEARAAKLRAKRDGQ